MINDQPNYKPNHDFPFQQATLRSLTLEGHIVCVPDQSTPLMIKKTLVVSTSFFIFKSKGKFHEMRYRDELGEGENFLVVYRSTLFICRLLASTAVPALCMLVT